MDNKVILLYKYLPHEPDCSTLFEELKKSTVTIVFPIENNVSPTVATYTADTVFWERWVLLHNNEQPYLWTIDIAYIPWVAFEGNWARLGHWWGRYDRFLADHPETYKIWVCFEEQIVRNWTIPLENHDIG